MSASKTEVFLGIDTSCYTTSVAVVTDKEELLTNSKLVLQVKEGKKGLAQSEMVFEHTRNLPELIEKLTFAEFLVRGIGVSVTPRSLENSYMPAFLVGKSVARSLATALNVPLYQTSHQENHLYAGLWSAGLRLNQPLLVAHLSGGTTELLKVSRLDNAINDLAKNKFELLAATLDISAGQFIDRIGVEIGLKFPTGRYLEQLAEKAILKNLEFPIAVRKCAISFSGPCTAAMRFLQKQQADKAEIAYGVLNTVAISLYRSLRYLAKEHKIKQLLLVGGVASNKHIRDYLKLNLQKYNVAVYWAQPEFSADNAVGCAVFAKREWNGEHA